MKISNHSAVPVYTISGASTARPLPEWLARKRRRSLKQDPEYANRIELLQDFEFEEASSCVRVSEDGNWVMSTGTYKPQIHVHNLSYLSLSFARHTDALNETFVLLSSDYSKSLHLQTDRVIEFHTPLGRHYTARIPRYGRDLVYDRRSTEALIPAVGTNDDGSGEVFRLNLETGRFMRGYQVDVGRDSDMLNGGLQGNVDVGSVNTAAIAEDSHNLLAFGTSLGTIEFWDPRSRGRVGILSPSQSRSADELHAEVTCLQFHKSGLSLVTGSSDGLIHLYDLRSSVPVLKKDQGYGYPIKNLTFLDASTMTRSQNADPKIMSSDKRIIKIWDARDGSPWTSIEPAVDLNHVEWVRDSGMLLTANEGRQQHSFFIPQLGPAPKWCAFLDNLVEEMAEDANDPNAFGSNQAAGEVYDNYKFLTLSQLQQLNMDHLVGTTSLLRPYMHGYFVAQKLYEEAKLIANPDMWEQQRAKSVKEKIDKERESRIRGSKRVKVKVNRKLAEKIMEREEKHERWKAKKILERGGDEVQEVDETEQPDFAEAETENRGVLSDPRFSRLFEDEDFEVDEASREFKALNPSTKPTTETSIPRGLTAVEQEELAETRASSDDSSSSDDETGAVRSRSARARKARTVTLPAPQMLVSSSTAKGPSSKRDKSFGSRAATLKDAPSTRHQGVGTRGVVGEREVTFVPSKKTKQRRPELVDGGGQRQSPKDRRSASGNVFRRM